MAKVHSICRPQLTSATHAYSLCKCLVYKSRRPAVCPCINHSLLVGMSKLVIRSLPNCLLHRCWSYISDSPPGTGVTMLNALLGRLEGILNNTDAELDVSFSNFIMHLTRHSCEPCRLPQPSVDSEVCSEDFEKVRACQYILMSVLESSIFDEC